ncbi:MAG: methionine adenosyltransferase [Planctomycetes bacterium GWF2_41_51]|nr:MAG: methionine adenosyltransferase [Planctomycetes bacterium GWF2_41_51]HBG28169.1 methionine adenosyltransferase [Phycisphaerales bacterium]
MPKHITRKSSNNNYLFTSESVTMGHPDKVADRISDAILDAHLAQDKNSRVACETLVKTGMAMVAGEITSNAVVDIPAIVRRVIKDIGYDDPAMGFDYDNCAVLVGLGRQSPDISQGVTEGAGLHKEQGAGDQGIMFGFACKDTPQLMPMTIQLAHTLVAKLAQMRENKKMPWLRPDGKSQVTVEYRDGKPYRIHTVVVSTQHSPDIAYNKLRSEIIKKIILPVLPKKMVDNEIIFHINPTGRFVIGGPKGDCGLTGRKIIVDTYGGMGAHGGGCFSGKDPSKVDRSASYMARYVAKNIVAADLADVCEIQLSYAIGFAQPVSVHVETQGTAKVDEADLRKVIRDIFPLTPKGIIDHLKLKRPIYEVTAYHGHFGRTDGDSFTWEKTDMAPKLRKALGLKGNK